MNTEHPFLMLEQKEIDTITKNYSMTLLAIVIQGNEIVLYGIGSNGLQQVWIHIPIVLGKLCTDYNEYHDIYLDI